MGSAISGDLGGMLKPKKIGCATRQPMVALRLDSLSGAVINLTRNAPNQRTLAAPLIINADSREIMMVF